KTGLGYDGQINESDLNDIHMIESEVLNNVVNSCENDRNDNQANDRFKKGEGYHAIPPPYTGNYMPPRADLSFVGLDSSESDNEDENVFEPKEVKKTVKPSLEKIEFVNARNTTVENENKPKKPRKFIQSLRGNKRNWNGLMTQKLGDGFEFKKKACFVCGSINHLIKDCDFYENKMVLKDKGKITGPKEIRPVWDNTARVNHQSKLTHLHPNINFDLAAVLTKIKGFLTVDAPNIWLGTSSTSQINKKLMVDLLHLEEMLKEKNSVLFIDNECVVLSPDFKLLDESQVLLKVPRNNNMYSFDLKNVVLVGGIENQMDHKVKIIRCDNRTEFKNRIMNELCEMKGIRREFSVVRTPQENGTRPNWMFDIDTLTMSMHYQPVFEGNQTNGNAGLKNSKDKVADDAKRKVLKFQEMRMEFRIQQQKVTKMIKRRILEIKKRPLENNLKNLKDCLVKGRLLTLTLLLG
nr:putative ribonuclease H-like domain-containing protein [Tanacetum cinerariifolium]